MSSYTAAKRRGSTSGIFAQNTEFFGTDLTMDYSNKEEPARFIITYMTSTAGTTLDVSLDSGGTWGTLNSSAVIPTSAPFELSIMVRAGDLVNFRTATAGGATVVYIRVDQQLGEVA